MKKLIMPLLYQVINTNEVEGNFTYFEDHTCDFSQDSLWFMHGTSLDFEIQFQRDQCF